MKLRNGFVSNSSSSSFVIYLKDITKEQLEKIINHAEEGERFGIDYAKSDEWNIEVNGTPETDGVVRGDTFMDNFDMAEFFKMIGIDSDKVDWRG